MSDKRSEPDTRDDGGPAFPKTGTAYSAGMTLRDYFAAAALHGLLANGEMQRSGPGLVPLAYGVADRMLAERAK